MKTILIDVTDNGEIRIETKGFNGPVCLEESQFLKDLLGTEISTVLVPCYYQRGKETVKRHLPICG